MARRARTIDPQLDELRRELAQRLKARPTIPHRDGDRRSGPRTGAGAPAFMRAGDLTVIGHIGDIGLGGVFLASKVLIEPGERGSLLLDRPDSTTAAVPVRVVWIRGKAHPRGPGMGLAFELTDPITERRAVELLLAVLDWEEGGLSTGPSWPRTSLV